jgi:hypothetical protein
MRPPEYCHRSTGRIRFDPGHGMPWFDPWYALVECDEGIIDYLSWLLLRHGIDLLKGSRWGAHVTFVRGEPPPVADNWAWCDGLEVEFFYTHAIHWTNGYHAWVNVWCPELNGVRADLGLPPKERFHLTLGRLTSPRDNLKRSTAAAATCSADTATRPPE